MENEARQPTVSELETEIHEISQDLLVFVDCRDRLHRRVQDQIDHPVEGRILPTMVDWSGTAAVLGCLDLSIHSMERVLVELRQKRSQLVGSPRGYLTLVTGDEHDES